MVRSSGLFVMRFDTSMLIDPTAVAAALRRLLDDPERSAAMQVASRDRAVAEFSYDVLADRLASTLQRLGSHTTS